MQSGAATPFSYKFSARHLPFMKEQIWEAKDNLDVYSRLSAFEFDQFQQHIGRPGIVLEVGCGLGRGTIYLNHLLQVDGLYILADRTGYTTNVGAFNPEVDEFYNDLELTQDFCRLNGVRNTMTFDTELGDWRSLPQADLIFSLCSFGMHVRIERYIDRLLSVSKPSTTMIFGTRHPSYGPHSFADRFDEVVFTPGADTRGIFPNENWLILKRPKA